MGIRFKLILPVVFAILIFTAIFHGYWTPKIYGAAKKEFIEQTRRELSAMEEGIIQSLLAGDYSSLYHSLERQLEKNSQRWLSLNLFNTEGKQLYPLMLDKKILDNQNSSNDLSLSVRFKLQYEAIQLGYIDVQLNWQKKLIETQSFIRELEKILFIIAIIVSAILLFLQNYFVRTPLMRLLRAINRLTQGDYNTPLNIDNRDELGQLSQAFETMRLERKKNEIDLQEQKYALDQHAVVAITDVQGTILFANDRFCEISGYSKNELLGKNHRILNSGYHEKSFFYQMYQSLVNGKVWRSEICNRAKDGHLYWVDSTMVPFMGENGKPKSYISIRTDITQQKQIETELIQAKNDAECANQSKSEFLASMSHEIRTPMNGVLGMLELLSTTPLNNDQQYKVSLAQGSANSLLTLINDILDFSKIDANKMELEHIDFDLRSMLDDFAGAMALQVKNENVELILDMTHIEHSMIKSDPGRLRQILTNLVGNAIKFTQQGEIIIQAELLPFENEALTNYNARFFQLHCKVGDTDIGIPEDKMAQLFEAFSQVDSSTTRKYGGTGLGLTIATRLSELMGGTLSAKSELGKGSCFEFTILVQSSEQSQLVVPDVDISKLDLLIVDDNMTHRMVLREQLEHWGANVEEVACGQAALDLCMSRVQKDKDKPCFDIAFLDMQMPEMTGAELSQKLKANPLWKKMKLVMMTAITYQGDAKYFSELGFNAYFPKPITTKDLFAALAVVSKGGDVMKNAQPLVTRHYIKTLNNNQQAKEESRIKWPDKTRVLLVEDNKVNQMVAKGILKKFSLEADIAVNGLLALEKLQQAADDFPYTIILMDCQMPEMDGYETTRQIRAMKAGERYVSIPIIAMTANAMHGDKEKCLEAGMSDYLSKPIDIDKLFNKISAYLISNKEN